MKKILALLFVIGVAMVNLSFAAPHFNYGEENYDDVLFEPDHDTLPLKMKPGVEKRMIKQAALPKEHHIHTVHKRINKIMPQKVYDHAKQNDEDLSYESYAKKLRAPIDSMSAYDSTLQQLNERLLRTQVAPPIPADDPINVDLECLIRRIKSPLADIPKKSRKTTCDFAPYGRPFAPEWSTEFEDDCFDI